MEYYIIKIHIMENSFEWEHFHVMLLPRKKQAAEQEMLCECDFDKNMYPFVEMGGCKYISQHMYNIYLRAIYLCMIFLRYFFIFAKFATCLSNYVIRKKNTSF